MLFFILTIFIGKPFINPLTFINTNNSITSMALKFFTFLFVIFSFGLHAQNVGVKTGTPNAVLDVNGSVAIREGTPLSIANGTNNNVAVDSMSYYRLTAPTAAFTITGFTNGLDGRILRLINATNFTMTLKHQNASSTAANRINTGGADFTIAANGVVTLCYNVTLTNWIVVSSQGSPPNVSTIGTGSITDSVLTVNSGVVAKLPPRTLIEAYAWGLSGNTGTTAGTNFLGTTDARDLVVKTNNAESMRVTSAGNVALGATSANTKLDVNGAIALREGTVLTLSNGTNNNVAIGNFSTFRLSGPTAAFSITGFTGGQDGRLLIVINTTNYVATFNDLTTSTAANQISTGGSNIVLGINTSITFQYNSTLQKWVFSSTSGSIGNVGTTNLIIKTVAESVTSSITLQDDNDFFFTVGANENWEIAGLFDVDGSGGDFVCAIQIPSGSLLVYVTNFNNVASGKASSVYMRASDVATPRLQVNSTAGTTGFQVAGILRMGATGGIVKVRWAQNFSNSTPTVMKVNSYIKVTRFQ